MTVVVFAWFFGGGFSGLFRRRGHYVASSVVVSVVTAWRERGGCFGEMLSSLE